MTGAEMLALLGSDCAKHPAWKHFCRAMIARMYGRDALQSAWQAFRDGWDTCEKVVRR